MTFSVQDKRGLAKGVGALLMALILVGGALGVWRWHTHPTVFPDAGNGWSGHLREGRELMTIGITHSDLGAGETVVLRSVAPRVRKNTAGAKYEFYVCTKDEGGPQEQLGMLSGQSSFERYCPNAELVHEGVELRTGEDALQQLVMVVRMPGPGVSYTTGVDLTYSRGLQRGTQLIGPEVRVTTT